jgi:hypothetical protein
MRIFIEISRAASKKLHVLAQEARRNPRQQCEWLLEKAIESASATRPEEPRREEAVHANDE